VVVLQVATALQQGRYQKPSQLASALPQGNNVRIRHERHPSIDRTQIYHGMFAARLVTVASLVGRACFKHVRIDWECEWGWVGLGGAMQAFATHVPSGPKAMTTKWPCGVPKAYEVIGANTAL